MTTRDPHIVCERGLAPVVLAISLLAGLAIGVGATAIARLWK